MPVVEEGEEGEEEEEEVLQLILKLLGGKCCVIGVRFVFFLLLFFFFSRLSDLDPVALHLPASLVLLFIHAILFRLMLPSSSLSIFAGELLVILCVVWSWVGILCQGPPG